MYILFNSDSICPTTLRDMMQSLNDTAYGSIKDYREAQALYGSLGAAWLLQTGEDFPLFTPELVGN